MPDEHQDDPVSSSGDRRWKLNKAALDALLHLLHPDQDQAARKYEELRLKLIGFFQGRRSQFPEEDADATIDRVCKKISEGEQVREVSAYSLAVARFLFLEASRDAERRPHSDDDVSNFPDRVSIDEDRAYLECLDQCLADLTPDQRELILSYYSKERREKIQERKRLADLLGIPANALRLRVFRLRDSLGTCVKACLDSPGCRAQPV
jgi:DNA-directed RNA polymerase specialized sigma24 family protein